MLFSAEDALSHSQCSLLVYSYLCEIETSWTFPPSMLAGHLVLSLFGSGLGSRIGETLRGVASEKISYKLPHPLAPRIFPLPLPWWSPTPRSGSWITDLPVPRLFFSIYLFFLRKSRNIHRLNHERKVGLFSEVRVLVGKESMTLLVWMDFKVWKPQAPKFFWTIWACGGDLVSPLKS